MDHSPLLFLPRELRDIVYHHYFRSKGGYVTEFATTNIMNEDGSRIDLALRLTCRQIATETRGLALQLNTITFQNTFFENSAGLLQAAHDRLFHRKYTILRHIGSQLLTAEMAQSIGQKYPQFSPMLENCLSGGDWFHHVFRYLSANDSDLAGFGEAPSLFRDFLDDFLLELSQHPDYVSCMENAASLHIEGPEHATELATTKLQTWRIYDAAHLKNIRELARRGMRPLGMGRENYLQKRTYSATSCAIRFLNRLSATDRMDIRHLLLVENSHIRAATQGASHARGLIPFCRENPDLNIVRRANLWHTVLPEVSAKRVLDPEFLSPAGRELRVTELSRGVGVWLAEYSVLGALGMPGDAYTLIMDVGKEEPHKAVEAFDIVWRDAVRQEELKLSYGQSKSSWFTRRKAVEYSFECLPDMLRRLAEGRVGVKCDFEWPLWRTDHMGMGAE